MVNWYCTRLETDTCVARFREHCRSPSAAYALFDFDMSIQLPPETSLDSCRRPAEEALYGKHLLQPPDIYQGERHYNPFAFDVACLGRLYLAWFKVCTPKALCIWRSLTGAAGLHTRCSSSCTHAREDDDAHPRRTAVCRRRTHVLQRNPRRIVPRRPLFKRCLSMGL